MFYDCLGMNEICIMYGVMGGEGLLYIVSVIPNVRSSGDSAHCTVEQVLNKFLFVATCLGTCDVLGCECGYNSPGSKDCQHCLTL